MDDLARAAELDAADPLAAFRERFLPAPGVLAYLDGNSLGRPLAGTAERMDRFVREEWGERLIRGWTEDWMGWPERVGDRLGAAALGAAPGQTVVADSTTVLLYKLARAAVDAHPDRREIVYDAAEFPTDRDVLAGIAAERGAVLRPLRADPAAGPTPEQVAGAVGPATALVLLSHVGYRSGWIADGAAVTDAVHRAGATMLWDLSHSAGSVEVALDAWGADLAVGCTYKYLNGGPGSPAFGYVRRDRQAQLRQPVQGWMGRADPFSMELDYAGSPGVRQVVSGTPPILAMVPLLAGLELLEEAGVGAVREKSRRLTAFVVDVVDGWPAELGARVVSPRDPDRRGGHVTVAHPGARAALDRLWERGVLCDYRDPDCLRIGMSPLSTGFTEVAEGLAVIAEELALRARA
jgi:kynureninase